MSAAMSLRAGLRQLLRLCPAPDQDTGMERWARDPVGYVRTVLKQELWAKQQEVACKLLEPPYKVLVKASHSVGKTFLAGALVNWWYDSRPRASSVITTAPTDRDVKDLLWREVRLLRGIRGGFIGDSAPEMRTGPNHFAKGFTANKGESFQGRHLEHMLFIFDEAVGIDPLFWTTTSSMFKPDGQHGWLAIFNPTDSSSQAHQEEYKGGWHVVTIEATEHPNIIAQLAEQPAPFPAAVSLAQVNEWFRDWAEPIAAEDAQATDLEWPPGSGHWLRPGPLAESRVLGRWPSQAAYAVWSDALWQVLLAVRHEIQPGWPVQIGCDVARFGDDFTSIHVRKGLCSLHHESHNGWDTARTAGRLKQLAFRFADAANPERRIPVLVDVGGPGAGVIDQRGKHNFVPVDSSNVGRSPERYRNLRSELWFSGQGLAKEKAVDVSRLDAAARQELGRQLLSPRYTVDSAGRLVVESKDETKKRIKRSPDDADSFNLSFFAVGQVHEMVTGNLNN